MNTPGPCEGEQVPKRCIPVAAYAWTVHFKHPPCGQLCSSHTVVFVYLCFKFKNKNRRTEELGNKSQSFSNWRLSWADSRVVWAGENHAHIPSVMIMKKLGILLQEAENLWETSWRGQEQRINTEMVKEYLTKLNLRIVNLQVQTQCTWEF